MHVVVIIVPTLAHEFGCRLLEDGGWLHRVQGFQSHFAVRDAQDEALCDHREKPQPFVVYAQWDQQARCNMLAWNIAIVCVK